MLMWTHTRNCVLAHCHWVFAETVALKEEGGASREAAKPPCATANPNKPSAICSWLLIMFSGWKWWEEEEEEEESAKRLKAIFEHLNASNQGQWGSGMIANSMLSSKKEDSECTIKKKNNGILCFTRAFG